MKAKALQLADEVLAMEYAPRLEISKELRRLNSENEQLKARKWIELTDEEVAELAAYVYAGDPQYVRLIEDKLKEKNT
jgi:hypothetical protein